MRAARTTATATAATHLPIDENVAVVAVLDGQDVAHNAVCGHGSRKVEPGRSQTSRALGTMLKMPYEPIVKGGECWVPTLEGVDGDGVGDRLDETPISLGG